MRGGYASKLQGGTAYRAATGPVAVNLSTGGGESCTRTWPAIALASIAVLLGAVALLVAATRSTNDSAPAPSTTAAAPTYTPAESAAAHKKLCDVCAVAARAVQIETNGDNPALSGIAVVNGALTLEHVVETNSAMPPGDRDAALALADAYSNSQATAATVQQREDPSWQSNDQ